MLPRYIGPALDFFDAFLTGRRPGRVPRVRWHLPHVGWQESPSWPPPGAPSCGCTSPSRRAAATRGGSLVPPGTREAPGCTTPATWCPRRSSNPFAALYEYPDERAVESRPDVLTFTTGRLGRAGDARRPRRRPPRAWRATAPSMYLHVKLVDVHPDGRAHALLFGQRVVDQPRAGAPAEVYLGHTGYRVCRDTGCACTSPRATSRSSSPTRARPRTRGTRPRRARTISAGAGGETPSYVSLTVLDD